VPIDDNNTTSDTLQKVKKGNQYDFFVYRLDTNSVVIGDVESHETTVVDSGLTLFGSVNVFDMLNLNTGKTAYLYYGPQNDLYYIEDSLIPIWIPYPIYSKTPFIFPTRDTVFSNGRRDTSSGGISYDGIDTVIVSGKSLSAIRIKTVAYHALYNPAADTTFFTEETTSWFLPSIGFWGKIDQELIYRDPANSITGYTHNVIRIKSYSVK
jgi:hypothetical protein